MSRLLNTQVTKHNGKRSYCLRCLNSFQSEKSLQDHSMYCSNKEAVRIVLPDEKSKLLSFQNYNRSMKVPFVIYADFEAFTEKINENEIPKDEHESYTTQYEKHSPSGFCYYIKCSFDESRNKLVTYTKRAEDEDVGQTFVNRLEEDIKTLYDEFKFPKKMILTKENERDFRKATHCHICEKELGGDRVRDHCHLSGKFRGAAHNSCNINYKVPKFFPVIFHNLSGYDSHLFIKNLGFTSGNISCIPNNEEKYISFTKKITVGTFINKDNEMVRVTRDIRFIDSLRFMASSLASLSDNLDEFPILTQYYQGRKFDLLKRKGVYPYEYMDDLSKLEDEELPPIEKFYSRLNDEGISEEDYAHAQTVWREFDQ